jgi:hypothetical protein
MFLLGLVALVAGVSSHFDGVPLPVEFGSRIVTVGVAEFRLDFVLMMLGVPLVLAGLPGKRARWR